MGLVRLGALGVGATLLAERITNSNDKHEQRKETARQYQSHNNTSLGYPNNSRDPPPQYQATRDGYGNYSLGQFGSQQCPSDGAAKN